MFPVSLLGKSAFFGVVGYTVMAVSGLSTNAMFAAIVAIELAQFPLLMGHRGRIAALEAGGD